MTQPSATSAAASGPHAAARTWRRIPLFAVGLCALAVCAALSLALGTRSVPLSTVLDALGGTVLQLVLTSWTSTVMLASKRSLDEARFWLAGSLAERPLSVLWPVLPPLLIGLVVALAVTPALNTLALGDDTAQALGVPVSR